MMKYLILGGVGLLGSTLLAGCGLSGNVATTLTGNGNHNISGPVQTSPNDNSSTSSTPPTTSTSRSSTTIVTAPSHNANTESSTSNPSATTNSMTFYGNHVVRSVGTQVYQALPTGFKAAGQNLTFSTTAYHRVEGFTGTLEGHPFVLDFYQNTQGLFVGIQYNQLPTYFGYGPAAGFDVLAFNKDTVVLGNMAQGTYMAINLLTGQQSAILSEATALNGYMKSTPPAHIFGLPGTNYPVTIP